MATTTGQQFELLVSFMERNEGIAKNYLNAPQFKETTNQLWNEICEKLNQEGPPLKSVDGWKKVWKDFKYNVKNKIRYKKKCLSGTGGGPYRIKRFSPLEERVDGLLDITTEVNGIENAQHFVCSTSTIIEDNTNRSNQEVENNERSENPTPNQNRHSRNIPKKQKETTKMLLKKQVQMQEDFQVKQEKYQKELLRVLKDIRDSNKQMVKLEREKLQEMQKNNLEKNKLKASDLELKKSKLELKAKKLYMDI